MDDVDLLARLLDGDQAAFVEIVNRYHAVLVGVARRYVRSEATANDVAQDTWIAVLKGIERFEGRSSFKTWLLRICANRAKTTGIREQRTVSVDLASTPSVDASRFNDAGMWSDPPAPFTDHIDDAVDRARVVATLRWAIDALPDPTRAVVTLRDVEGLTTREVAELLDLSEGNVRVILHRGRAALRAVLEETMKEASP